jgi:hypothetical protein
LLDITLQQGVSEVFAECECAGGGADEREFTADEHAFAAELEEPSLVAVPRALELDGFQSVAVVKARCDQEQRFEVDAIVEVVRIDEMLEVFSVLSAKVLRQDSKMPFDAPSGSAGGGRPRESVSAVSASSTSSQSGSWDSESRAM